MVTSVVVVGVGGQGVLTLARWLGESAMAAGYDVRIAEVHGISQRGGSVEVHVRFGEEVHAPVIEEGGADYVLAMEALEALRGFRYLSPTGVLVVNKRVIQPPGKWYDVTQVVEAIAKSGVRHYIVPAFEIALQLGSPIYENAVLLGVAAKLMGLPMPSRLDDKNKEAFLRGAALV